MIVGKVRRVRRWRTSLVWCVHMSRAAQVGTRHGLQNRPVENQDIAAAVAKTLRSEAWLARGRLGPGGVSQLHQCCNSTTLCRSPYYSSIGCPLLFFRDSLASDLVSATCYDSSRCGVPHTASRSRAEPRGQYKSHGDRVFAADELPVHQSVDGSLFSFLAVL